jgi:succinate-acetate transporter protein
LAAAGVALAVALFLAQGPVARLFASWTSWREESTLALLAAIGAAVYGAIVFALFGRQWLAALRRRKRPAPLAPPPPD